MSTAPNARPYFFKLRRSAISVAAHALDFSSSVGAACLFDGSSRASFSLCECFLVKPRIQEDAILEFGYWSFLGIWCLGFGASPGRFKEEARKCTPKLFSFP
jgi:hypothetical protein